MTLLLAALLASTMPAQDPACVVTASDPSVSADAKDLVREEAVRQLLDLGPALDAVPPASLAIVIHPTESSAPPDVREHLHEGTAGVTMLADTTIHLVLDTLAASPPRDLRTVLRHELVHVLLHQLAGPAGPHVPRWLHEGVAQELSAPRTLAAAEEDIAFAAHTGNLLLFRDLADDFPTTPALRRRAYAQSLSFVAFLRRKVGLAALLAAARACGPSRPFPAAFQRANGRLLVDLETAWLEYLTTGSGGLWRQILASCFSLTLLAALPLLALASSRRASRDHESRVRLERGDVADPP